MKKIFGTGTKHGGVCSDPRKMIDIDTGAKTTDLNTIKDVGGTNHKGGSSSGGDKV